MNFSIDDELKFSSKISSSSKCSTSFQCFVQFIFEIIKMEFVNFLPLRVRIKILKALGLWQTVKSSRFYLIYGILVHIFLFDLFLILEVGFMLTMTTFREFLNLLSVLPTSIAVVVKSIVFLVKFPEVENVLVNIQEILETCPMTEKVKKRLKKISKVHNVLLMNALLSNFFVLIGPFNYHDLPFRMWYPFTYDTNLFMFWAGSIYQLFVLLYIGMSDLVFYVFPLMFLVYIFGMLEQLNDKVKALIKPSTLNCNGSINTEKFVENSKELIECIKHHQRINEVLGTVQDIFSVIISVGGLQATLIICMVSLLLTEVRENPT